MYSTPTLTKKLLVLMSNHSKKHLVTGEWKKLRLRILARDGYVCAYCGQEANQVDHVVAIANGGDVYDPENLVASCRRCNLVKGTKESAFFSHPSSTPPVFIDSFIPNTVSTRPSLPVATLNETE